jgi:hypothetical protein
VKKIFFRFSFFVILAALFVSCESLPFNFYLGRSWSSVTGNEGNTPVFKGTIKLAKVSVDRTGGWASVEKEIAGLAPLLFWEQGYRPSADGERADYAADIRVREREYAAGWKTKRSLAVEVRIWPDAGGLELYGSETPAAEPSSGNSFSEGMPLAAGRITSLGDRSFSSSETTGRMLSLAIQRAVKALRAKTKTGSR